MVIIIITIIIISLLLLEHLAGNMENSVIVKMWTSACWIVWSEGMDERRKKNCIENYLYIMYTYFYTLSCSWWVVCGSVKWWYIEKGNYYREIWYEYIACYRDSLLVMFSTGKGISSESHLKNGNRLIKRL